MSRYLSIALTALMITLAPFSAAILLTWDTLPGEAFYPLKRGLESIALVILSPSFAAKSSLQSQLVSRRTTEAVKLISGKDSTQGLEELRAQIAAAKIDTLNAKDAAAKRVAARQLIAKLQETNQALEVAKTGNVTATRPITYRQPTAYAPSNTSNTNPSTPTVSEPVQTGGSTTVVYNNYYYYNSPQNPSSTQNTPPPTPTVSQQNSPSQTTPTQPTQEAQEEINNTQEEIDNDIADLIEIANQEDDKHDNNGKGDNNNSSNSEKENGNAKNDDD